MHYEIADRLWISTSTVWISTTIVEYEIDRSAFPHSHSRSLHLSSTKREEEKEEGGGEERKKKKDKYERKDLKI